jgi:hypothetical protein
VKQKNNLIKLKTAKVLTRVDGGPPPHACWSFQFQFEKVLFCYLI